MTEQSALSPNDEYAEILEQVGDGVPGSVEYDRLSRLILSFSEAHELAGMDPFSASYRQGALDLYISLRGRSDTDYVADRDEPPATPLPDNLWTGLVPWSFQDAKMTAEHLYAWGHAMQHMNLSPGGSVLEYGPGSGQLSLMLSRLGYDVSVVDIEDTALEGIRAQADALGLPLHTERAGFGFGFEGARFDCVFFYEAFHHAFEFEDLLVRLHERINPGGRVVLCGEPVVPDISGGIPYPWGPRLDALSVFCIRRFGWMELGFTRGFLIEMCRRNGWSATFHPFPNCGRAEIWVLEPLTEGEDPPEEPHAAVAADDAPHDGGPGVDPESAEVRRLRSELAAMKSSTSWRVTRPVRSTKDVWIKLRQAARNSDGRP